MIKRLLTTLLFLSVCSTSWGATQQVLIAGTSNSTNTTITEYNSISQGGTWTATEADTQMLIPSAGTLKDFRIVVGATPDNGGGTQLYKFTIRVNGAEPGSPITCTISESETSCQSSETQSITAGDLVSLEINPDGTPDSSGKTRWSMTWNPTTSDESIMLGGTGNNTLPANNNTRYVPMTGFTNDDDIEFDVSFIAPTAGVFKNLYVNLSVDPGGTATQVFSFRDSASAETIDCTISAGSTTCTSTLGSETATASAGERFVLVRTATNTPDASRVFVSIVFDPTIEGEFIYGMASDNDLSVTATEYNKLVVGDSSWTTDADDREQIIQTGSLSDNLVIKNMYVELETDPGATGDIYTFTLQANNGNATATLAATCDGVQTCNAAAIVTVSDDDQMATKVVPTDGGTLATGSAIISYTGYITPTGKKTQQVIASGADNDLHVTATEYNGLVVGRTTAWNATESEKQGMVPAAGTLDDLRVKLQNDPANGANTQSFAFMIRLDTGCDGTGADTTLTCTVSEGSTTCNNSDGFSVNAGECVGIEVDPDESPTVGNAFWTVTFNPTTADESVWIGGSGSDLDATTQYFVLAATGSADSTLGDKTVVISTPGTFKNLHVDLTTAPGGSETRTFTFGSVDCTITGSATSCNSAGDTQVVAAGETYDYTTTTSGSAATSNGSTWGIVFDPVTQGEWMWATASDSNLNATSAQHHSVSGHDTGAGGSDTLMNSLSQAGTFTTAMTAKDIYIRITTAPGVGNQNRDFTFQINNSDTTLGSSDCVIEEEETACNETGQEIAIANDDLIQIQQDPTIGSGSDPDASGASSMTLTAFIPPVDSAVRRVMVIN